MQNQVNTALSLTAMSLLAGCFGFTSDTASILPDSEIRTLLEQSNIANYLFSDAPYVTPLHAQGTTRFDVSDPIPLYFVSKNGDEPPHPVVHAIAAIEDNLGNVFTDIQLLTEDLSVYKNKAYPNQNVGNYQYSEQVFKNQHGIIGGVVIAIDTAFYSHEYSKDPESMCGNASIAPYSGSISLVVDEQSHTYVSETLYWVNLGNGMCNWGSDIVIHEVAHAFGMYQHVDDYFGSWSSVAMDLLKTLYLNPAGTPYNKLKVY
jgi:hypothetical protein